MEHQSRLALAMSGEVRQAPQVSTAVVDLFGQTGFQQQMDQMVLVVLRVEQRSKAVPMQMFKQVVVVVARVRLAQMQLPRMVVQVAQDFRILLLEPQPYMAAAVEVESVGPGVATQALGGQEVAVLVEKQQTVLQDQQTLVEVEVEAAERPTR